MLVAFATSNTPLLFIYRRERMGDNTRKKKGDSMMSFAGILTSSLDTYLSPHLSQPSTMRRLGVHVLGGIEFGHQALRQALRHHRGSATIGSVLIHTCWRNIGGVHCLARHFNILSWCGIGFSIPRGSEDIVDSTRKTCLRRLFSSRK
jgi:hypothetical protein